jgi:branched-chain amino acid transport system ATP-binding protein
VSLLEVHGLTKRFGGLSALSNLSLAAEENEIVSIIGPNGAGKTTFFNMVTGLYGADEGEVVFNGHQLLGLPPNQITKLGLARTFQTVHLFPNMTVLENVMVGQHCRSKTGFIGAVLNLPTTRSEEQRIRKKSKEVLTLFGTRLTGYRHDQPASVLSYANRRRLEIARALATEPRLLLLDEPTAGMNPRETAEMTELIGELRRRLGIGILVIEHDMRLVKGVSDRVIALDYGAKIAEGSYDEVAHNDQVIEAYLGRKAVESA